jgi:hypothetical protein
MQCYALSLCSRYFTAAVQQPNLLEQFVKFARLCMARLGLWAMYLTRSSIDCT